VTRLAARLGLLPGEGARVGLAFAWFALLLGGYYVLRAVREEMGIRGGVERLHESFLGTFLAMLVAVPLYSALVARVPRARAVPLTYRAFNAMLLGFAALVASEVAPPLVARGFFVWVSVYGLFVVSVFWTVMADLFSSAQGRRLFGLVAAGGSAGAIVGPGLAVLLAGRLGVAGLLLAAAAALEGATRCAVALFARAAPAAGSVTGPGDRAADRPVGGSPFAGFTLVARDGYLALLAAQMLLATATATVVYFQQARLVSQLLPDPATRLRLFAGVDLAVNALSLLMQAGLFARLVRAIGLGPTLALPAGLAFVGLGAIAAAPVLPLVAGLQGTRRAVHYALEKPAREVLFTVLPPEAKYKAKSFIDTVVYRGGDALAALGAAAVASAGLGLPAAALLALPLCALWILVVVLLRRRHAALEART
jgi:AAA family ATP:ADP antiporter